MFCELLQEDITDEACTTCWDEQMYELAKEYMAHRLVADVPRTITHEDCKKENLL